MSKIGKFLVAHQIGENLYADRHERGVVLYKWDSNGVDRSTHITLSDSELGELSNITEQTSVVLTKDEWRLIQRALTKYQCGELEADPDFGQAARLWGEIDERLLAEREGSSSPEEKLLAAESWVSDKEMESRRYLYPFSDPPCPRNEVRSAK